MDITTSISLSMKETDDIWNLTKMYNTLIKNITIYGTPQFSSVARMAFISKAICNSLITTEHFDEKDIDLFYNSIETVASEFRDDFVLYKAGDLT